jgi:hypothetical protein
MKALLNRKDLSSLSEDSFQELCREAGIIIGPGDGIFATVNSLSKEEMGLLEKFEDEISRRYPDRVYVRVASQETDTDPALTIYCVCVLKGGVWQETFGTLLEVNAFLRGMCCCSSILGKLLTLPPLSR